MLAIFQKAPCIIANEKLVIDRGSQCANRDADDAALHHYLHQTTAEARQLIESALEKVIAAEGISL